MTQSDEQIDLLMRRLGRTASGAQNAPDHLDADEMNAFAEGFLPPAARARFVSHLANCDQCRKQVAQLSIASGAVARVHETVSNKPERRGFWAALSGVFAVPALRYAAFAAIAILVAGVGFFALRHRSEQPRSLIATNEPLAQKPEAVKPPADTNGILNNQSDNSRSNTASSPAATSASPLATLYDQQTKQSEDRVAANATPPPALAKEAAAKVTEESEKKAEQMPVSQSQTVQAQPSYAPVPPGETQQSGGRVQSQSGGVALSGGFKNQPVQTMDKAVPSDRERDTNKDARADQANQSQSDLRRGADEKLKGGPSRNTDNTTANTRNLNEVRARAEAPKTVAGTVSSTEEAPQTRAAGGHKFRRQGNSWVDQKFKSSMALKNVSRGSDDFEALDGGLRSIAQQIGGEVIIVWKGKAYLIK